MDVFRAGSLAGRDLDVVAVEEPLQIRFDDGIPEPPQAQVPASVHRRKLPAGCRVTSTPVLGGLHHEYRLQKEAA